MDSITKYLTDQLEDRIFDTVGNYVAENVPRPFGIVLSGGFDSGLLAAITKPDYAFRVHFPYGSKFDESRYADAIAEKLDLEVYELEITPERYKKAFEPAIKTWGQVTGHFSLVPLYLLMKEISEFWAKNDVSKEIHILSGEGPDEYLGGYARQIIIDQLRQMYFIPELRNYKPMLDRFVGWDGLDNAMMAYYYSQLVGYDGDRVQKWLRTEGNLDFPLQGIIGKMDMDLGHIEDMEQAMAKKFKVNLHYPYINDEFADYCYRLPDSFKIKDGVTKWGFRQVCKKYLPAMMMDRSKMGGPVAPVNKLMGWDLPDFDKTKYIAEQKKVLGIKDEKPKKK